MTSIRSDADEAPVEPWLLPSLCAIFFVSGVPALIYQLIWQRSLFTIYGVNIESITIVVAAFMLGLGIGSSIGGVVSKRAQRSHLLVFGLIELCIGAFGFASLGLFSWVGELTLGASMLETGLLTFGLVLFPTVLMGATLPILVAFLVGLSGNVGRSVGLLYFVNTLGSAVSCFIAARWLFGLLGKQGAVTLAASLNIAVGVGAIVSHWRIADSTRARAFEVVAPAVPAGSRGSQIPLVAAIALAAMVGFISLSYEILWARIYSFAMAGRAHAFAYLLGSFLAGIALGSLFARRFCRDFDERRGNYIRILAVFLIGVNVLGYFLAPMAAEIVRYTDYRPTLLLVILASGGLGAMFPLISHAAIPPDRNAGARLSYLYLGNIVGSTAGSLITGLVLMRIWGVAEISTFLALCGLGTGLTLLFFAGLPRPSLVLATLAIFVLGAGTARLESFAFGTIYEKLLFQSEYRSDLRFAQVVESRSGVVTVEHDGTAYGGGTYDGKFSTSLVDDRNGIVRAFILSALHPAPRDVLMIGLATGSWAQVVAHNPDVERVVAVEINQGYLDLIGTYPIVSSLLENPKVEVIVDDGRRWLAQRPDAKFDIILMNNTYPWRSQNTNLLSVEFLENLRGHLKPGGILQYNTTYSEDVLKTGVTVFPYAQRFKNNLLLSNSPIEWNRPRWQRTLSTYEIDGVPVVDLRDAAHRARLNEVLGILDTLEEPGYNRAGIETRESLLARTADARVITDDNMGTEWKR